MRCPIIVSWHTRKPCWLWIFLSQDMKKKRSQHEMLLVIRIIGWKPGTNNDLFSSIFPITMTVSVNHNYTNYISILWLNALHAFLTLFFFTVWALSKKTSFSHGSFSVSILSTHCFTEFQETELPQKCLYFLDKEIPG